MTIFWVIAALITIIVLLMLVLPMLRRNQHTDNTQDRTALNIQLIRDRMLEVERDYTEQRLSSAQYKNIKQELQLALAKDLQSAPNQDFVQQPTEQGRWMAWVVMLFVPILAVSLYWNYGDSRGFNLPEITQAQTNQPGQQQQPSAESIEKMVDGLAARLKQNPDDQQGWFMLGRSYMVMGRYAEASNAYAQLLKLVGDNANVLLQYTQAKVMSNGGQWDSSSIALLDKASKLEPENPVALSLSGLLAAQQGQADTAVGLWRKAQQAMQPNSEEYNELDKMIASINNNGASKPDNTPPVQTTESATSPPQTKTTASASAIEVKVSIAPELLAKTSSEQTIFIFAQALSGPPMPIAVARKKVSELPVVVTLDDSMAMMPTRKLSSFEQVRIAARISQSGSAMPSAGDLEGKVEPVDIAKTKSVSVVIDQVL
ncbi:MAG: c-type cytochrome biogenesis protein CcmI [Methylococcales bacterium]